MIFKPQETHWGCQICSKTEKPQDYINMVRHIWWHNEMRKKPEAAKNMNKQTPLTPDQEKRINTIQPPEQQIQNAHDNHMHGPAIRKTHNNHTQ